MLDFPINTSSKSSNKPKSSSLNRVKSVSSKPSPSPTPPQHSSQLPNTNQSTSTTQPSAQNNPEKLNSLKTRIVQLLALGSRELSEITAKLHANPNDVQVVLNEVASFQKTRTASTPIYSLKNESWQLVKVDDWRPYTESERQAVGAAVKRITGKGRSSQSNSQDLTTRSQSDQQSVQQSAQSQLPKSSTAGKTRQNLLRASQGKNVSRSPSPAKALLNNSNTNNINNNNINNNNNNNNNNNRASSSSRSPSVLSTQSNSTTSKESNSKRKIDQVETANDTDKPKEAETKPKRTKKG